MNFGFKRILAALFTTEATRKARAGERARVIFPAFDLSLTERVLMLITDQLGVDLEQLSPDTEFITDLEADDLDSVELVMAIEEEFRIAMTEPEAEEINTIGDLLRFLQEKPHR